MIRVLLIARYRDATMWRKVTWLAQERDLQVRLLLPRYWQDPLLTVNQANVTLPFDHGSLAMVGRPDDPHRALYRTVAFGLLRYRPDIIHAEEEPDSLAALQIVAARALFAPRARLILHTWQNVDRPKRWYVRATQRLTTGAAAAIFCANRAAAELLHAAGYQGPTPVVPAIGVDTTTFTPCAPAPPAKPFVIGFVGRLVPEKGVDLLLRAVARLCEDQAGQIPVRLLIIGDGPERTHLQELATSLGISDRTEFLPAIPPREVAKVLCQFSTLVLPSRTTAVWQEQLGRVLLEAMATGIPVVGSDSGAIPEVIGDAGLIFPEDDVEQLAACLHSLARDAALRSRLSALGLQRAQNQYSQQVLAVRTAAIYRQVIT